MKKTLYISDLDGTLLNEQGVLSDYTRDSINRFIAGGGLFTVATARSQQAAKVILEDLHLTVPAVLTNGVAIYDMARRKYLQVTPVPADVVPMLVDIFRRYGVCGFLYTLERDEITVFYEGLRSDADVHYHAQRMIRYEGRVYQRDDLVRTAQETTATYFVVYGRRELLESVHAEIEGLSELTGTVYEDVYDNQWCFMDIFAASASKATGMRTVMELCGADEAVAFGDNYNDLAMLQTADRSYATANAVDAAKAVATGVIGYCHEDGVARFIESQAGN